MTDTDLFTYSPPASVAFDGATYEPDKDHKRLRGQLLRVFKLMKDGKWRTLEGIKVEIGGCITSVSARLRDLRKEQYGGHEIERERVSGGLFKYRLKLK